MKTIAAFIFLYPVVMAWFWMAGAVIFHVRHERPGRSDEASMAPDTDPPFVSILLPCFNEGANVDETVGHLMRIDYPAFEVIAVNDGSRDDTGARLDALAARHRRLRVIHQASNQGKAVGLNTAALVANGEILVGIDGDAVLDPAAVHWLVRPFARVPDLGAVTGNPRIRTRSTVLGRLQVAEFSSIVGLIKRAQQVWFGHLFTVSGVVVAFRRRALEDVGLWSNDMLTEDIDISWKLQAAGWSIRFEPRALVWILMPETLRGLWKQRLRWAMGGVQVVARHAPRLASRARWRMWPVLAEYLASLVWSYLMAAALAVALLTLLAGLFARPGPGDAFGAAALLPGWTGLAIAVTCLLQFTLSLAMDRRYDVRLFRHLLPAIWYPVAFWMIGMVTSVCAVPSCLMRARGERAVWISPDRGVQSRVRDAPAS